MPFTNSTIATAEAELWGLTDSANRATAEWRALAGYAAQLGGPQDGVFNQLDSVQTELNSSGGPRGWLPGLLVAILGLVFGSVAWISTGLNNWLQWAKTNAMDGFNDFIEGFRALLEAGPQVAMNAMQGAIAFAQNVYQHAQWYTDALYQQMISSEAQIKAQEQSDFGNLGNYINTSIYNLRNQLQQQEQGDVSNLGNALRSLQQQEQADTGNLHSLIDQNFFTLQQQEHADTQNLQTQINTQVNPNISALQGLLGLQVLPELSALTQLATQTAGQLKQDEEQCIDPMCKNLGKTSNATGILGDLGILALVLAFIAECMANPSGVSGFIVGAIAPDVNDTTRSTTGA